MKEYYIHIFKNNSVLLSNLPEELREEADRCSCNLTNSMCPIRHVMKRQNKEIITDGYIYMCSYDTSITNKIFLHYFDMLRSVHIAYEEKIKNEKERLMKISGITSKNGRNDAKRLNIRVVTVSNDDKPKNRKTQRKADLRRRMVCKSLPVKE